MTSDNKLYVDAKNISQRNNDESMTVDLLTATATCGKTQHACFCECDKTINLAASEHIIDREKLE